MMTEAIKKYGKQTFATHKATLLQDTDRYFAADYRRADGSSNYYINFIVDKQRGSLIISGDLGDCIATWYNPLTPQKINGYIRNNVWYFIEKIQCSTDMWRYDSDDAYFEIYDMLTDGEDFEVPANYCYLSKSEFFAELREEVDKSYDYGEFHPTEKLWDMVAAVYPDCESLHCCGRSVAMRVWLWLYAFDDVCRQIFDV